MIINEEFKSQFFKTLNKTIKNNYKDDNESQKTYIDKATNLIKRAYAYKTEDGEEEFDSIKKDLEEMEDVYGRDTFGYIRDMLGCTRSYYDRGAVSPKKSYSIIVGAKADFSNPFMYQNSYENRRNKIRTNKTSVGNDDKNSFKFISNILANGWYKAVDINNITDDRITKIDKIPKVITDKNKWAGHILFWFYSQDVNSDTLSEDDKLTGISYGSQVYYPEGTHYHGKYEGLKIKDLAAHSNKIFALSTNDEGKELYDLRKERENNKWIYRYMPIGSLPYSSTTYIEMDNVPDNPTGNGPQYIKVNGKFYELNPDRKIFSNIEYERDEQYAKLIEDKIKEYKTILQNRRFNEEGCDFDVEIEATVNEVHEYLMKLSENGEFKTSTLRNVYQKMDKMLSYYQEYLYYKKKLQHGYSNSYKQSLLSNKKNAAALSATLMDIINKGA